MRVIEHGRLWIGNSRDSRDAQTIFANNISAVVDLAIEELPAGLPREIIYCRFPLSDDGNNLPATVLLAIKSIAILLHSQIPTLVACSAGMSRSPATVAAALAIRDALPLERTLAHVSADSRCDVSPEFYQSVASAIRTIVEET